MVLLPTAFFALLTLRAVYRGGRTWNDHAVAAVLLGCFAISPLLWLGLEQADLQHPAWALTLLCGPASICGLFLLLDRRQEVGPIGLFIGALSQVALAFALWTGLLYLGWLPWALATGEGAWAWPGAALALPAGLALWGGLWTAIRHNAVVEVPLTLRGLRRPLRVVHLSDLHASPFMTGASLRALVDRVNRLSPELVLITGDLVMPFSEAHHAYLIEALRGIAAPTFHAPGNHDLPILSTLAAELSAIGQPMLVDEVRVVQIAGQAIELLGLQFHWRQSAQRHAEALARLPAPDDDTITIGLVHDPRAFAWLPPDRFDLVLSGHTHGGQVGTDMFGWPGSVLGLFGLYDQGRFVRASSILSVHRGNWHIGLPPRMGVGGEIVLFTLSPPA